ncbi:MAG TPA: NAD(+)/NADH kinase [candidate division Zixibacteria bacterium]|nr:NAD(+)/NADH kinase [candidate division Zixibacteria bacterium]
MRKIEKALIFANPRKPEVVALIGELARTLESCGVFVLFESRTADCVSGDGVSWDNLPQGIDMVISLGGDGTMLASARNVGARAIPVLGINLGRLGFLNELDPSEIAAAVPEIVAGKYAIVKRMMLDVLPPGEPKHHTALNEMVLDRGNSPRIIFHKIFVSGEFVAGVSADGLIVSSPTGSTAYNMAAGGGILSPDMEAFQVTALSPYTLSIRPLVVDASETVEIEYSTDGDEPPRLTLDGQSTRDIPPEGRIEIRKAPFSAHFVHYHNRTFYEVLRDKLGWASRPRRSS